ncbi:hypothetical protein, partial [Zoogloea sp. LCSB751]|uniref:hypothetical protein n=1 Tax=Zoogloea sp. LCSB751 TaxID=1965277 RepID=UPI001C1F2D92
LPMWVLRCWLSSMPYEFRTWISVKNRYKQSVHFWKSLPEGLLFPVHKNSLLLGEISEPDFKSSDIITDL